MTHSTRLLAILIAAAFLSAKTSALAEGDPGDLSARRVQLLELFDKDGDGAISEAERAAARDQLRSQRAKLLEQYDKDGDGRLSRAEREEAGLPQAPKGWRPSR
jgi:Ca2+-binding EF-hand superfamily protein